MVGRKADGFGSFFLVVRQRKLDRAPALLVLSLPERLWTPDGWEKEDGDDEPETTSPKPSDPTSISIPGPGTHGSQSGTPAIEITAATPTSPPASGEASSSRQTLISAVTAKPSSASPSPSAQAHGRQKQYFSKDECAICLQGFQRGEVIRILPCGHVFHKVEVDDWLLSWKKLVSLVPLSLLGRLCL